MLSARMDAATSRIEAAEEALDLVRARNQAGDAIQLEVLAAIRELAEARADLVLAITEYNQAQYLLFYQVEGDAWARD